MTLSPEILSAVNTLLLAIITGISTVVIPMLWKLFKAWVAAKLAEVQAKVEAIQDERKRAAAQAALQSVEYAFKRLDYIVVNTVDEIAQTSTTNTNLSEDEKRARLEMAVSRIKHQLPEKLTRVLAGTINDFDRYLVTKIEATRFQQKKAAN